MAHTSGQPPEISEEELGESLRQGLPAQGRSPMPATLAAVRRRASALRNRRRATALSALGCVLILALLAPIVARGRSGGDDAVRVDTAEDPVPTTAVPTTTLPELVVEPPPASVLPQTPPAESSTTPPSDEQPGEFLEEAREVPLDPSLSPLDAPGLAPSPPLEPGGYWFVELTFEGKTTSLVDEANGLDLVEGGAARVGLSRSCAAYSGTYTTSTGELHILLTTMTAPYCEPDPPPDPAIHGAIYEMLDSGPLTTAIDGAFVVISSDEVSVLAFKTEALVCCDDPSDTDELLHRWTEVRRRVVELLEARG